MKPLTWLIIVLAVMTAGCTASKKTAANRQHSLVAPNPTAMPSQASDDDEFDLLDDEEPSLPPGVKISDPLQPLNRAMFTFNHKLYLGVIEPGAKAYKKIAPQSVRVGIRNFFNNLTTPMRFVSSHLQGKHKAAGIELHRFAYNTTFGVLGFGDPAKDKLGLESTDEDLGQALGKRGVGNGVYFVLPFFGPSTVRDTVGLVGDQFLNPVRYINPTEASIAVSATKYTNKSSFHIGEYKRIWDAAIDPYIAFRQIYLEHRNNQVEDRRVEE